MEEGKRGRRKEKRRGIEKGRRGIEEREEEREEKRECGAKDAPPPSPQEAFPSQELGNNMTPIKGRLGKNTTPTRRNPE